MRAVTYKHHRVTVHCFYYTQALLLFLCLLVVGGTGCGRGDNENSTTKQQPTGAAPDTHNYETLRVAVKEIPDEVGAVGVVQANQEVDISPEITGKISTISCDVGEAVRKGEILAIIDDESRVIALEKKRAQLRKAEAADRKAHKDAHKNSRLFREGVISDSESDDGILEQQIADAELSLARAEVRSAEKELRDTRITAPFSGKIASKSIELGKLVTPGQSLFTLVDITKVKIIVHVSELDIAKIAAGGRADAAVDSLDGAVFQGRVKTVELKADDATRTFPVEVIVDNERDNLLPGMVARVRISATQPKKVLLVPRKAVRPANGLKAVYLLIDGTARQRIIQPGGTVDDQVIVEKGLAAGDTVIVSDVNTQKKMVP